MRIAGPAAFALFALAWVPSAHGQQRSVKAGIEAWQSGDYATAVNNWRPLAEKGDPDAAFNLGQAYRLGRGVTLSLGAAQTWLERAAKADHLDAQTTLGLLLFQNGNRAGGLRWLKAAAERGEPRAMLVYGTAIYNGDGVPRDPVTAYAFVSRAAAQGLAPAKETLAEMDKVIPVDLRQKGVALALTQTGKSASAANSTLKKAEANKITPKVEEKKAPSLPASTTVGPSGSSGAWRIQLGAFSQRSSADALFKRLAGKLAGKQPYYVPVGSVTRLQVGPYPSRAAAAAACAGLSGQACFPVAAK